MRYFILMLTAVFILFKPAESSAKLLTEEQALKIGRRTPEVKALYRLDRGRRASCINSQVDEPCESEWVSCIEEAWVVKFIFDQKCFGHDGRLGVTLLIDAKTGKVISRFPEKEYFKEDLFCRDDFDCMRIPREGGSVTCKNFIHAPLLGQAYPNDGRCRCGEGVCISR